MGLGRTTDDSKNYSIVSPGFWDDSDFPKFYYKLMWIYITSTTDYLGIHDWSPKHAKVKTDLTKGQIQKSVDYFVEEGKAFWVDGGQKLWIPSKAVLNLGRGNPSETQTKAAQNRLKTAWFSFENGPVFVRNFLQVLENKYSISIPYDTQCNVIQCNVTKNNSSSSKKSKNCYGDAVTEKSQEKKSEPPPPDRKPRHDPEEEFRREELSRFVDILRTYVPVAKNTPKPELYKFAAWFSARFCSESEPVRVAEHVVRYRMKYFLELKTWKEVYAYATRVDQDPETINEARSRAYKSITPVDVGLDKKPP